MGKGAVGGLQAATCVATAAIPRRVRVNAGPHAARIVPDLRRAATALWLGVGVPVGTDRRGLAAGRRRQHPWTALAARRRAVVAMAPAVHGPLRVRRR